MSNAEALREYWRNLKADPDSYQARQAAVSAGRKGKSTGSRKGIGGWKLSDSTRQRQSEAQKNRVFTEEHRRKLREAKLGKPQTNPRSLANLEEWRVRQQTWVNGTSYEGQFTYTLRRQVWQRDGHNCQDCNREVSAGTRSGVVHHVDFDKGHNEVDNLVLLCRSCHMKRHDRDSRGRIANLT